jgi:hypothetical protein
VPLVFALVTVRWRNLRWVGATVAGLALALASVATDTSPTIVLLLPGANGDAEAVLAPVELLGTLDSMALGNQPTTDSLLQSANYEARLEGDNVRVRANWQIHSFRAGAKFELPSHGADIAEIQVNGIVCMPKIDGQKIAINLPSPGKVTIQARMVGPISSEGADHSFSCAIPAAMMTQLFVELPNDTRLVQLSQSQSLPPSENSRWNTDLGRTDRLQFSWRSNERAQATGKPMREGYLWEIDRPYAKLFGIVKIAGGDPTRRTIEVDLPDELELISVSVPDSGRVLNYELKATTNGRQCSVALGSISASAVLVMEYMPRKPLALSSPLPFPSVHGTADTIYAWRGQARLGPTRGVTMIGDDSFTRDFLIPAGFHVDDTLIHAWRKNTGALSPFIRVLDGLPRIWSGMQSVHWHLGPNRAEVTAAAELSANNVDLALVEWEVPLPVTVINVSGSHVTTWTRTGTRLQIWLDQPRKSTRIEWMGFTDRRSEMTRFDTPIVRLLNSTPGILLTLTPRPGWDLIPITVQQLTAKPQESVRERVFQSDRNNYRLVADPRAAISTSEFRVLTAIHNREGHPMADITIEVRQRVGEIRGFIASLTCTPDDDVEFNAPGVTEIPSPPGRRRWLIEPPIGLSTPWSLQCEIRSLKQTKSWNVPDLAIDYCGQTPASFENLLTIGRGMLVSEVSGLDLLSFNKWRVARPDWKMEVEVNAPRPFRK